MDALSAQAASQDTLADPQDTLEPTAGPLMFEELELAGRNHSMPLEALRLDPTPAGLHYLLTHFDIPVLDPSDWRLDVGGAVRQPLEFTLDALRDRPRKTLSVTLECAGNGRARLQPRPLSQPWLLGAVGTAAWTGTPLGPLLDEAGLDPDAVEIVFTGADRGIQGGEEQSYGRSLTVAAASAPEVLLAYEMNGAALPVQHGSPLRLVVPGWYGMTSVKWLTSIEAVEQPFEGFQQASAYRYKQDSEDPGQPVTRIHVRSLMIPPGIPDFFTRRRVLSAGPTLLRGRAWSGHGQITSVEVGIDGTWTEARLDPATGEFAWRGWSLEWDAAEGDHELSCRATDASGDAQPVDQAWNYQGIANNAVQRVSVTVDAAVRPATPADVP